MTPNKHTPCQDEFNRGYVDVVEEMTTRVGIPVGEPVTTCSYWINGVQHGLSYIYYMQDGERVISYVCNYVNGKLHGPSWRRTGMLGTYGLKHWYHGATTGLQIKPTIRSDGTESCQRVFIIRSYTFNEAGTQVFHQAGPYRIHIPEGTYWPWRDIDEMTMLDMFTVRMMGIASEENCVHMEQIIQQAIPTEFIAKPINIFR